jgi:hypothetical protein
LSEKSKEIWSVPSPFSSKYKAFKNKMKKKYFRLLAGTFRTGFKEL